MTDRTRRYVVGVLLITITIASTAIATNLIWPPALLAAPAVLLICWGMMEVLDLIGRHYTRR